MIEVTVRQAAMRRGVKTYYQLARLLGDSQDVRAMRLWDGSALPTLATLDKVCDALGCDLAELVKRTSKRSHAERSANSTASKATKVSKRRLRSRR